jgi:hypothetical protein
MKAFLSALSICCFTFCNGYSQGAWDIAYLPMNRITKNIIDKEIRVDFKLNNADTIKDVNKLNIRALLFKKDTTALIVNGTSRAFVENWKIYADNGVLSSQTLMAVDNSIQIDKMFLIALNKADIDIKCDVKDSAGSHQQIIKVPREKIKGLLLRN